MLKIAITSFQNTFLTSLIRWVSLFVVVCQSVSTENAYSAQMNVAICKEISKTCNVLPFSCTHLALFDKAKSLRLTQNKRLLQISLTHSLFLGYIKV
jgi:hypothetical protein